MPLRNWQKEERDEAIEKLRAFLPQGAKVFATLRHFSLGKYWYFSFYIVSEREAFGEKELIPYCLDMWIARATGLKLTDTRYSAAGIKTQESAPESIVYWLGRLLYNESSALRCERM